MTYYVQDNIQVKCKAGSVSLNYAQKLILHLDESTNYQIRFLAPLAVGQRAYVMVSCPSCVRPSVNFFFKHLLL